MEAERLDGIIGKHKKWLNCEGGCSVMIERSYTASELRHKASVLAGAANRAFLAGSFYMADIWRRMALECLYWANLCDKGE